MNTTPRLMKLVSAVAVTILLLLPGMTPPSATARPDPGEANTLVGDHCLLQRVGTQYVRCDNLTGNGVPAPAWVPH